MQVHVENCAKGLYDNVWGKIVNAVCVYMNFYAMYELSMKDTLVCMDRWLRKVYGMIHVSNVWNGYVVIGMIICLYEWVCICEACVYAMY